ncbi:MAG: LPXTG cell wall anchor domain-containing protein [Subdoligranulum variabile]|nr:LPXTG cell wall anchor domain-containing protein [Gemmiger sp.]MBS6107983.1 LPXTG cell wall anchor domain-containing protein [Subdoligranulum variabile]MBT9675470.1 LPXTG cell wall anchor domain-containing protein [Gemmiger formicilis]
MPTIPQTGDNSSVTLLFALLLLSGGAYLGMAASKKAKQ